MTAVLNEIDAKLDQAEQGVEDMENAEDPDAATIANRRNRLNGIWTRVHTLANKYSIPAPIFNEQPTAQNLLDECNVLLQWEADVKAAQAA